MSTLSTPAGTIEMRDKLAEWIETTIVDDARFTMTRDVDHVYFDVADDLIRSGWVTAAPEVSL